MVAGRTEHVANEVVVAMKTIHLDRDRVFDGPSVRAQVSASENRQKVARAVI